MMSNAALAAGLLIPVIAMEWVRPALQETAKASQTQPAETKKADSITMQEDAPFRENLMAQERRFWEAIKAGDWKAAEAMCSDRVVTVCPTGFEGKAQAMEQMKKTKLTAYTLSEWKSIKIDNDNGLILYKAECTMTPAEGGSDKHVSYNSTLWRREGGTWKADMHQATMAEGSKEGGKR